MANVKLFADFWNFQLRWNAEMSSDPAQPTKLNWHGLPSVLIGELPSIVGTTERLIYKGAHVFASVNPRAGGRDEGLKRFLHSLSQATGFQVTVRERRPKKEECPHCKGLIERTVEKGVDAAIVTALYEGAINDSYDIAILLSNDADHVPAIRTIQDRLNKQIIHVGFKRGGTEIRTATGGHILLDGALAVKLVQP